MTKKIRNIVCCCLMLLPFVAIGQRTLDYNPSDFQKGGVFYGFDPSQELVEKRSEKAKHFRNADGSITAVSLADRAAHYKDANGIYKSITEDIVPYAHHGYGFANTTNTFQTYYAATAQGGMLTDIEGFQIREGERKQVVCFDAYGKQLSTVKIADVQGSAVNNKITYANAFAATDLRYTQQAMGVKMDYIIQNRDFVSNIPTNATYVAFAETVQLPEGVELQLSKNNKGEIRGITVVNKYTQTSLYDYETPYYMDNAGKGNATFYKVEGNTIYTMVAADFLRDTATVYPITIDPTKSISPSSRTSAIDGRAGNNLYHVPSTAIHNMYGYIYCDGDRKRSDFVVGMVTDYNSYGSIGNVSTLLVYDVSSLGISACSDITSVGINWDATTLEEGWWSLSGRVTAYSGVGVSSAYDISYKSTTQYASWSRSQLTAAGATSLGTQALNDMLSNGTLRVVLRATGSWYATADASGWGCGYPMGIHIYGTPKLTVTYTESKPPTVSASESEVCPGEAVTLKVESPDCEMTSVEWREGSATGTVISTDAITTVNPMVNTTYYAVAKFANGNTSTSNVTVTMKPSAMDITNADICEGGFFPFRGKQLYEQKEYRDTVPSTEPGKCDSIYVCNLTVHDNYPDVQVVIDICEGDTLDFYGEKLTQAGPYTHTDQSVWGCDSVINLTLRVNPVYTDKKAIQLTEHICEKGHFDFHGMDLTETGVYSDTLVSVSGCDSVVVLTLTVHKFDTTRYNRTICLNNPYKDANFDIPAYDVEGVYPHSMTRTSVWGCDSVIELTLTVASAYLVEDSAAVCADELPFTHENIVFDKAETKEIPLTSQSGCDSIVFFKLIVNPVRDTTIYDTICYGETYTKNGFDVDTEGPHQLFLKTINTSCDSTVTLHLTIIHPEVNLGGLLTICDTEHSIVLSAGEGFDSYLWNDGSSNSTLETNEEGRYSVTVTLWHCTASDEAQVQIKPFSITMLSDTAVCEGNTLVLRAPKTASYHWSTGETTQSISIVVQEDKCYTVNVTNEDNCKAEATTCVTVKPFSITLPPDTSVCEGSVVILTAPHCETYHWSTGETKQSITVVAKADARYTVDVTNAEGCNATASTFIDVVEMPEVEIQGGSLFCNNFSATLYSNYSGNEYTYKWTGAAEGNGETLPITSAGAYHLQVKKGECSAEGDIAIAMCKCEIWIPNAFSPNNDGKNDIFHVYHNSSVLKMETYIFNRWGEQLYYHEGLDPEWNGVCNGNVIQQGTYVVYVRYICTDATESIFEKTQTIHVLPGE